MELLEQTVGADAIPSAVDRHVKDAMPVNQPGGPQLDPVTGEVALRSASGTDQFAIKLNGARATKTTNSAVAARKGKVTAVSQVTENRGGQIVAVLGDRKQSSVDFAYSLPRGYTLSKNSRGGFDLKNQRGEAEGAVDPGWAYDATGRALPTSYELINGQVLRQQVDTRNATFPVTVDPSWTWWLATSAKCAGEIAVAFTPLKVARVAKSMVNIAKKSKVAAAAIKKLGGASKAAVVVVKEMANRLKRSASKYSWSKRLPSFKLSAEQKKRASQIISFMGANAWEFLGFGSCGALLTEVRKK